VALLSDLRKVASSLEHAATLVNELQGFRVKIKLKTGHDNDEAWRENVHDDFELTTALTVWYARTVRSATFYSWS
jgi:hypothetical protein